MARLAHSRVSRLVHLLGLVALGVGLAQWFGAPSPASATHAVRTAGTADMALAALPAAHAPAMPLLPTTSAAAVAFELVDVVSAQRGRPRAVLRINSGPPTPYAWGEVVSVGVRLSRILPSGVELQRGSVVEYLPLVASAFPRAVTVADPVSAGVDDASAPTAQGADEPSVIARPVDQAPPSSHAIDRAIRRATAS